MAKAKKGVPPFQADVEAHIRKVARAHPECVKVRQVGSSVRGQAIHAVTVTDPTAPAAEKQHVLVTGGQHGNEESGRIVALALLDWLVTKSAATTRRKQRIVIMPLVNPDGADDDTYGNSRGVLPNRDHAIGGAKVPEGKAVEVVSEALQPELYLDLHACGGTGCHVDMVLYPQPKPFTEDDYFLHKIADEMVAAGEAAGIPQKTHPLSWWGASDMDGDSTTCYHYRRFKSLVLLTENTEHNLYSYSVRDRARAGLAKLKAVLAWGNRRHPKLYYPGYPNQPSAGQFDRGIVAIGRTMAARRRSRIGIWRNVREFTKLDYVAPIPPLSKTIHLGYAGERLRAGAGVQIAVRGKRRVVSARLDGRRLRESVTSGHVSWQAGPATYTVVAIGDLKPGEYVIEVEYR